MAERRGEETKGVEGNICSNISISISVINFSARFRWLFEVQYFERELNLTRILSSIAQHISLDLAIFHCAIISCQSPSL